MNRNICTIYESSGFGRARERSGRERKREIKEITRGEREREREIRERKREREREICIRGRKREDIYI